uniref:hypothetical protein n=1 Tax=uncultured Bacteroides sp. TaxID=162156 RepID=UPI0025DB804E|nr:hypothetical protein [uncultured Bacteroides sp.]
MENKQLELFSLNYAESGNTNQLSSMPGEEPLVEKRNTDGCSIFLPAAGNRNNGGTSMNNVGSNGNYWSSQQYNSSNGQNFNFNSSNYNLNNNNRNNGFPVRCCLPELAKTQKLSFPVFNITKEQLLVDLFKAYYDARKHKRNTCFIIEDPVKREIFAADFRDRVVHHLVYNYIMPIFERTFIADSYSCRKGKGTLYGVKRLDQLIKRQLREKHYGRYVDDSYIINRSYATLRIHKETIRQCLREELGLTLHPKKSKIVRCCIGIDFLGIFVKPHRRYISNRTKRRIFRKSVPLLQCMDVEKLRAGINSYLGYMKHFKCGKIKERLFSGKSQLALLGEFIEHYSKFCLLQPEVKLAVS